MFYAVGQQSQIIYAQGTKADCLRELQQKYPTCSAYSKSDGRDRMTLPEPMKFVHVGGVESCQHLYNVL
ncbi:hypothetical protein P9B03_02280 [Metasolibacillus meyeri]|uniref:Uncharacterized protein n=1 Tax=Metasolibacillus meyeri TaxID=1071052 RepID=A0AAW9NNI8_9BACL|nr:hypothetical protein [Metasolibacillus meyeri]MEC1177298.1 hypothetical protein [Metasolibacillus meyeri]